MIKKVVVFGHSHVWPVRRALGRWSHPGLDVQAPICGTQALPGQLVTWADGNAVLLNPVIAALLADLASDADVESTWLVSMVQGNYYNQMGMFVQDGLFDFVLPTHPELPPKPKATLIPYGAVKDALEMRMKALRSYLSALAQTIWRDRLVVVGPPPPIMSKKRLADMLAPEDAHLEVSPGSVRLKLWHLQNTLVQGYCQENGIFYLSSGLPETQTPRGFLLPKYVKDSVHANHDHAALLLDEIARHIMDEGPQQ